MAVLGCGCVAGGARLTRSTLWRALRQCSLLGVGVYLLSPLLQVLPQPAALNPILNPKPSDCTLHWSRRACSLEPEP